MMDMEKLCQLLLTKMDAIKEEMKADRKTDKEEMEAYQAKAEAMLAKLDAYQEKAAADRKADKEEIKAAMRSMRSELDEAIQQTIEGIKARTEAMRMKIGPSHMEMVSAFKPKIEKVTMACQEMEARLEEEKPISV
jgi:chemotaxis protein histidine kinase CheA